MAQDLGAFPHTKPDLEATLIDLGLRRHVRRLVGLARPAILLHPHPICEERVAIGISKMGGNPDLPPDVPWPESPRGHPLSFITQIDLSKVRLGRHSALARDGLLSFFYDSVTMPSGVSPDHVGHVKVIHTENRELARRPQPLTGYERMCDEFESCLLDFEHIWSVPVDTSVLQDAGEWCRFAERFSPSFPISKVWGLPDVLQEATEVCCERVSHGVSCWDEPQPTLEDVEAARRDWRLLLQVASEPSAGMRWGSGSGRLFFQVRERDASIGDFDRVLGLMQDT